MGGTRDPQWHFGWQSSGVRVLQCSLSCLLGHEAGTPQRNTKCVQTLHLPMSHAPRVGHLFKRSPGAKGRPFIAQFQAPLNPLAFSEFFLFCPPCLTSPSSSRFLPGIPRALEGLAGGIKPLRSNGTRAFVGRGTLRCCGRMGQHRVTVMKG